MRSPSLMIISGPERASPTSRRSREPKIVPVSGSNSQWEVRDCKGENVFILENAGLECQVREWNDQHPQGRGAWLMTFLGPAAFQLAKDWARGHSQR